MYDSRMFLLGVIAHLWLLTSADGASTCMEKDKFASECIDRLKGIVDGGRCYFVGNKTASWTDSWGVCTAQGGSGMAQIHTGNEMKAITAYLAASLKADLLIYVGMMHELSFSQCFLAPLTKSSWYSDAASPIPNLNAANTWIRTHQGDDCWGRDGQCVHMFTWFTKFGDYPCQNAANQLCELQNANQDYKLISGTCLTETPILTTASTDAKECSIQCNSHNWCRSFNFRADTSKCELFSWAINDGPSQANVANCAHYTYMQ